mmetsp:Transcript_14536/g.57993  ORF Transcript_14536/g.57993 Transcript_14536/m.57993 type:complete len:207 (+) Transcript_14536:226-846(+)
MARASMRLCDGLTSPTSVMNWRSDRVPRRTPNGTRAARARFLAYDVSVRSDLKRVSRGGSVARSVVRAPPSAASASGPSAVASGAPAACVESAAVCTTCFDGFRDATAPYESAEKTCAIDGATLPEARTRSTRPRISATVADSSVRYPGTSTAVGSAGTASSQHDAAPLSTVPQSSEAESSREKCDTLNGRFDDDDDEADPIAPPA